MAKLLSPLELQGRIGQLSFYRRSDCEQVIIRQKGGPSRRQVKELASMAITRLQNNEFTGRCKMATAILTTLAPLKPIADFNHSARLNKLAGQLQQYDTVNPLGSRSVSITAMPGLLQGFQLNNKWSWDDVLPNPPVLTFLDGDTKLSIQLPALVPGINLLIPQPVSVISFRATAAWIDDLHAINGAYPSYRPDAVTYTSSAWFPAAPGCPAQELLLDTGFVPGKRLSSSCVLLVAMGMLCGTPMANGEVAVAWHRGAGKIIFSA